MTGDMTISLWSSYFAVIGVWVITVISPGPNFAATVQATWTDSRRAGFFVALGIALGDALWAIVSLGGLGLLFEQVGWLYHAIRVLGALYLIHIGYRMFRSPAHVPEKRAIDQCTPQRSLTGAAAFRRGLLTALSNPKAAAFFSSLFAVAIPLDSPFAFQAAIVTTITAVAGAWYGIVTIAVAAAPVSRFYGRAERWIGKITGAVFMGFGARLLTDR